MTGFSKIKPNDLKAYAEYCEVNSLRPALSTHPIMYFVNKDGKTITKTTQEIYKELGWKLNPTTNRWSRPKDKKADRGKR